MTISLPESIADITLQQSIQLDKLNAKRDTLDDMSFIKRFLVIFTGMKYRDISNVNVDDFNMMFAQVSKALETESPFQDRFELDGVEYGFVPNLDEITIGEYIDLSNYGNSLETMNKVMAVLFRPVIKTDVFGSYEIAAYDGTKDRAEVMKQAPMNIVSGMLVFFLQFIEGVKKSYPEIYSSNGGTEKQSLDYFDKWGWYATIDMITGGDILKMDETLLIKVFPFHNFLAHKLDKQKMEATIRQGNNVTQL